MNCKKILLVLSINILRTSSSKKYDCTNGIDPKKMSYKDYLIQFSKGKCSPILIVPSLMGSKLIVQIKNCSKLRKDHPDIFQMCGWNNCLENSAEKGKSAPQPEYRLWIPYLLSPMSVLKSDKNHGMCFAKLISKKVDFTKPIETSLIEEESFRVRIYGNSPKTKSESKCGDETSSNLAPFPFQLKKTLIWKTIINKLKDSGYLAGLTYQVIPYDWTKSIRNNENNGRFKDNLLRLNQLTNKKVVLVGHSFGNKNIHFQLQKMNSKDKDKLIKLFISVGDATLGTPEASNTLFAGSDFMSDRKKTGGLHVDASIQFISNIYSLYELILVDEYNLFKNQKWYTAFNKRREYEEGKVSFEESEFLWLPKKEDSCAPNRFKFDKSCKLGLYDAKDLAIAKIENKEYTVNETRRLFEEWQTSENLLDFYDLININSISTLKNPEVPMVAIIFKSIPTAVTFEYEENIFEVIKRHMFPKVKKHFVSGDGTVVSNSLYAGPLKWAYEFDKKEHPNAKPVKIVDFCSVYKQRNNPYDFKNELGELFMTKNEFFGSNCECIKSKDPVDCNHGTLISDKFLAEFVANTLFSYEVGYSADFERYIDSLSINFLKDVAENCVQLDLNIKKTNRKKLIEEKII